MKKIIKFRDDRNWAQFHNSKDLSIAISIEVSELAELFLWKKTSIETNDIDKTKIAEELADILIYSFLFAEKNNLNIQEIIDKKLEINTIKYPIKKSINTSKKYNLL